MMLSYLKAFILSLRQANMTKWFQVLFTCFLVYFAIRLFIYHYYLVIFPYPNTCREGALMATTTMLLHGVNPYNFLLEPQYTNIYGIVYPLIVLPLASLFGVNLVVHRVTSAFFILASCLIIFFVLYKKKTPLLLIFWAMLTLYACLLFPLTSTPCVDPASTGLFFMLLTIFIPFLFDYSNRSLVVSIVCGVLAFYTKPYFFLGIPVMVSYLFLFISKRKSIFFGGWFLLCFALSVVAMNHFFPSYFDDCFFIHNNYASHYSITNVLQRQLYQFADLHKGIFFLVLLVSVYSLGRWLMAGKIKVIKKFLKDFLASIRWKNWEDPLISSRLPLDVYAGICSATVLLCFMGKHYGANLWYFFQLFSPFLVIFIAWLTGQFILWPIVLSSLLIYNLFSLTSDDHYKYFDKKTEGWQTIEMLIKSHGRILHSPLIAPLLIKENREIFDSGSTEYFFWGGQRKGLWRCLFKEDNRVYMAQAAYFNKIQNRVENKEFDLVIIAAGDSSPGIPDSIRSFYTYVSSIFVYVPQDRRPYLITIWQPNK